MSFKNTHFHGWWWWRTKEDISHLLPNSIDQTLINEIGNWIRWERDNREKVNIKVNVLWDLVNSVCKSTIKESILLPFLMILVVTTIGNPGSALLARTGGGLDPLLSASWSAARLSSSTLCTCVLDILGPLCCGHSSIPSSHYILLLWLLLPPFCLGGWMGPGKHQCN